MTQPERLIFGSSPPEQSVSRRVGAFLNEMHRQSDPRRALGKDPYLATLSQVTADLYETDGEFQDIIDESFSLRQRILRHAEPRSYSRDANQYQKSVDYALYELPGPVYKDQATCRDFLWFMLKDDTRAERFYTSMGYRNVATNIEQRYAAIKVAMSFIGERFDHPVRYLDVGTSLGLGPKQVSLSSPDRHPFHEVNAYTTLPDGEKVSSGRPRDEVLTRKINERLGLALPGQWLGVDLWTSDRETEMWAVSNRFRPAEKTPQAVEAYTDFVRQPSPHIRIDELDILSQDKDLLDEVLGTEPRDVGVLSTVANQFTAPDLALALRNTKRYISDGGVIFLQDFAWPAPEQLNGLRFDRQWGSYNTLLYDMANPDAGWQHLFEATNGRALEYITKLGTVAVGLGEKPLTMEQHLRAS